MLRNEDVQMVKSSVTMRQIARMYGYEVTRSGFMKCPFHSDSNPSMKVYDGQGGYCCFACHAAGDIIEFVREHDGLDFEPAVRLIAEYSGIPISDGKEPLSETDRKNIAKHRAAQEAAEKERKANQERLKDISRDLHWLKERQAEFKPLGPIWCVMQKKIEKLTREWDFRFDTFCNRKG